MVMMSLSKIHLTFSWMKASMEGSIDKDGPFLNVSHEPIWNGYIKPKKKGYKIKMCNRSYNKQYPIL